MATRQDRLAHAFVELADTLVEHFDVVDLLSRLGERCVELFDAGAAGLLLADGHGVLRLMAATSEAMEMVELFQLQNAEGPCLDCYQRGEPVEVEDLAAAGGRWPLFAPVATAAGFRSAHAFPLRLRGRVLGALNLFRSMPGHLAPGDVAAAQALADVATIAILQHRAAHDAQALADQLYLALNSRILIEQAKGVIAEQAGIEMDEAFARLRGYARRHQRLLGEVAQDVIDRRIPGLNLIS
jgi:GAF domain-containing protein